MKEKAIAKLMIATMIVDSHRDKREYEAIRGTIGLLGVTEEEYIDILKESEDLQGVDEVLEWSKQAIETLQDSGDSDICSIAVANMVLVACADNIVKESEEALIQATALSLGVPSPVRR